MNKEAVLESLKDGLIVSCQAVPEEPHYMEGITVKFAECAAWAGAKGIRANSPEDIRAIKAKVDLPIIGIWKINRNIKDVYLTPNLEAAKAVWEAGAEIIAVQATHHYRDDGKLAYETIREIKENIPEALIFADVSNAQDARIAAEMGADFVAPTLAGYTQAGAFDKLEIKDGRIYINGTPADKYTFAMDYYFMMGDNRHNSLDSRYWGFVPEDHIVGKPSFVWMSLDKDKSFPANIRWNRIFSKVK